MGRGRRGDRKGVGELWPRPPGGWEPILGLRKMWGELRSPGWRPKMLPGLGLPFGSGAAGAGRAGPTLLGSRRNHGRLCIGALSPSRGLLLSLRWGQARLGRGCPSWDKKGWPQGPGEGSRDRDRP